MEEKFSEFGKGFTYCIALFLAHQHMDFPGHKRDPNLWFNGASDHLIELEIPDSFTLKDECEEWKNTVVKYGHGMEFLCNSNLTERDIEDALEKAKQYLIAWDKQCGVNVLRGGCE